MCCAGPAGLRCSRRSSRSWRSPPPDTTRRWCSAASIRACRSRSPNTPRSARLTGKYSQFVFAGAAIGVVAPAFKDWHKAFWDNLAATIQLHNIKKVIAINHRDCGAAKIAYGEAAVADEGRRDRDPPQGARGIPQAGRREAAQARGRNRPDGAQRQVRSAGLSSSPRRRSGRTPCSGGRRSRSRPAAARRSGRSSSAAPRASRRRRGNCRARPRA